MPDFKFKALYDRVNQHWNENLGWPLFISLREDDKYKFENLHIPVSENRDEFDDQVKNLAVALIDSLNEKQIRKHIKTDIKDLKGISKLEVLLKELCITDYEPQVEFLHQLWGLRIGAAHRQGKRSEKANAFFKIEEHGYIKGLASVFVKAIEFLNFMKNEVSHRLAS